MTPKPENISSKFAPAKRENNPNRDFIIVNKFQSKHYPSDPTETFCEFLRAGLLLADSKTERAVVIGFSETATAIGAFAARAISEDCFYLSTTREPVPEYFEQIYFEESHSHAKSHTLCIRDREIFAKAEHIFLVDDEFTTGNTIVALVNALKDFVNEGCRFTAAAFVASEESRATLADNGIECVNLYDFEGIFDRPLPTEYLPDRVIVPRKPDREISRNGVLDFRLGVDTGELFAECGELCAEVARDVLSVERPHTVQIIGTEEFCLAPVILGDMLEESGCEVRVHSATRSPMLPSLQEGYPIHDRAKLMSLYDINRTVYLYNSAPADLTIILTDSICPTEEAVELLCGAAGGEKVLLVRWRGKAMPTSVRQEDGILLLKDVTGLIQPLSAKEREPLIQSGVHYCELLPAEYRPSEEYVRQYEKGLERWAEATARAVMTASEEIYRRKGKNAVIVSLARAGTPVGMLIKRYIKRKFGVDVAHYSISIIRGRGIDKNAMRYILARHKAEDIQFVDGWTGKGAIIRQLDEALTDYPQVDRTLAVLADPAGVAQLCGTHEDIFIPCSCLNSVVSGLFSRTVLRDDIIGKGDFHGAAYFGEMREIDRTYSFIDAVEREMDGDAPVAPLVGNGEGLEETKRIAEAFGVAYINLVKPSIGETTRVLLRRIPKLILVRKKGDLFTAHIEELAAEKGVEVREYPLENYRAVGLIQALGDV